MPRIGSVSERYQSYNVEMIEVTGGRFWKPYRPAPGDVVQQGAPPDAAPGADTPSGMNADLYQYRPPIDLSNARLRKLAAALGPAYVRVSGTWANTTYFSDEPNAARRTARRVQGRAVARAVERRRRFRAGGERGDRHLLRHRGRSA